jgi:hypothetical protein
MKATFFFIHILLSVTFLFISYWLWQCSTSVVCSGELSLLENYLPWIRAMFLKLVISWLPTNCSGMCTFSSNKYIPLSFTIISQLHSFCLQTQRSFVVRVTAEEYAAAEQELSVLKNICIYALWAKVHRLRKFFIIYFCRLKQIIICKWLLN